MGALVSPRDVEELLVDEPAPARRSPLAREHAARVVEEVGSGPAAACSVPVLRFSRPRYGWSCDPDGRSCPRGPRRLDRPGLVYDSPEADALRRLAAADFAALPLPVRGPRLVVTYTGRAHAEAPPLRQVGVAGDLAAALVLLPERRSRVRR